VINTSDVLEIHSKLIEDFGGAHGVRDHSILDSAINRPFQTFDQKELYPTPQEKAAAQIESIVINHPFNDGNKRTGYFLMRAILLSNQMDIEASEDEKYNFVLEIAKGNFKYARIANWITDHLKE